MTIYYIKLDKERREIWFRRGLSLTWWRRNQFYLFPLWQDLFTGGSDRWASVGYHMRPIILPSPFSLWAIVQWIDDVLGISYRGLRYKQGDK